MLPGTIKQT